MHRPTPDRSCVLILRPKSDQTPCRSVYEMFLNVSVKRCFSIDEMIHVWVFIDFVFACFLDQYVFKCCLVLKTSSTAIVGIRDAWSCTFCVINCVGFVSVRGHVFATSEQFLKVCLFLQLTQSWFLEVPVWELHTWEHLEHLYWLSMSYMPNTRPGNGIN